MAGVTIDFEGVVAYTAVIDVINKADLTRRNPPAEIDPHFRYVLLPDESDKMAMTRLESALEMKGFELFADTSKDLNHVPEKLQGSQAMFVRPKPR